MGLQARIYHRIRVEWGNAIGIWLPVVSWGYAGVGIGWKSWCGGDITGDWLCGGLRPPRRWFFG